MSVLLVILLNLAALVLGAAIALLWLARKGYLAPTVKSQEVSTILLGLAFILVVASSLTLLLGHPSSPQGDLASHPDLARDPRMHTLVRETLQAMARELPPAPPAAETAQAAPESGLSPSVEAPSEGQPPRPLAAPTAPGGAEREAILQDPSVRAAVQEGLQAMQSKGGEKGNADPQALSRALQGFTGGGPVAVTPIHGSSQAAEEGQKGDTPSLMRLLSDLGKGMEAYKKSGQTEADREHLVDLLRTALKKGTLDGLPQAKTAVEQMLAQESSQPAPSPETAEH